MIGGEVSRILPPAIEGTVLVDMRLLGEMPRGARTEPSVDRTFEIEWLEAVLLVGRPIQGRKGSMVRLFKLDGVPTHASRVQGRVDKAAVSATEIRKRLREADTVIVYDMSARDAYDRVQLE